MEHHACMVDLLGHFGDLDEAENMIKKMYCSIGTRLPGWGSCPPRFPHPRDGGTPGGCFPMSSFWGDVRRPRDTRLSRVGDESPRKGYSWASP
jgi:hypothetical protein